MCGVLVGSKTDLPVQRHAVDPHAAEEWAHSNGLDFLQVSAVRGNALCVLCNSSLQWIESAQGPCLLATSLNLLSMAWPSKLHQAVAV